MVDYIPFNSQLVSSVCVCIQVLYILYTISHTPIQFTPVVTRVRNQELRLEVGEPESYKDGGLINTVKIVQAFLGQEH